MDCTLIIESNSASVNQLLSCVGSFSCLLDQPVRSIYILNPYIQEYNICLDTGEFHFNDVIKLSNKISQIETNNLIENLNINTKYIWYIYGNSVVTDNNCFIRIFDFLNKNQNVDHMMIQSSHFYKSTHRDSCFVLPKELQDIIRRL